MRKLKIAVLFGGYSSEYDISLQSAYSVIAHMDTQRYEPVLIGITRSGAWRYYTGAPEKIKKDTWDNPEDCRMALISPDRETRGVLIFEGDKIRTVKLDAAMPVLHGRNGEDGTVQGLLTLAGIPVIGCKTLASALCMDKDRAHKIAVAAGVRVPRSFTLKDPAADHAEVAVPWGYPFFVKPVKAGSSHGITKVVNASEWPSAVKRAFAFDDEIIVEENIAGVEVSCAIMGADRLFVGAVNEVELDNTAPAGRFFDYNEKYFRPTARVHVPARVSTEKAEEIKQTAVTLYRALGCQGFARVDMFLTPGGEIVFNEVNTIPGFTENSHYATMMKAAGLSYEAMINRLIESSVGAWTHEEA